MFVVANVEEVVSENGVTNDEHDAQCILDVSIGANVVSECVESDEDIEVDIDGSDGEDFSNTLIPGEYKNYYYVKLQ